MTRALSPYEVLELRPGASRDAVEAAYRRLIKQNHPDVPGGDAERAKAIIHAYRALTRGEGRPPAIVVRGPPTPPREARRWRWWLGLASAAAILWLAPWPALDPTQAPPRSPSAPAERPLSSLQLARTVPDQAAVEAGVSEAGRLERATPQAVVAYGRSCAADLRRLPGEALLDHCLAFDMAATRGQARFDPWLAPGPLERRHRADALRVLGDGAPGEARVREIRLLVERQLAAAAR